MVFWVQFSIPMNSMRRSSTMELESAPLDKIHVECESASVIPPENSCYVASSSPSAEGSGLDSDFGASAGVSLRILSMDSDGFPGSAWASALEWDYYDPSYVTQNHIPKHRPHAPPITTKQYWV
ncbi:protein huluwa [Garra rufa]|uniref:protein huluwa n=1 Tax=Garra rufa TaxID=137080 RepID=UPI003CCED4EF